MSLSFNSKLIWPSFSQQAHTGWWKGPVTTLVSDGAGIANLLGDLNRPVFAVLKDGEICLSNQGELSFDLTARPAASLPLLGFAAPAILEKLGDASFCQDHGLKYAYIGGSMAHGISSPEIAIELGRNGMLGFIGAAGQSPARVEQSILKMKSLAEPVPYGF